MIRPITTTRVSFNMTRQRIRYKFYTNLMLVDGHYYKTKNKKACNAREKVTKQA